MPGIINQVLNTPMMKPKLESMNPKTNQKPTLARQRVCHSGSRTGGRLSLVVADCAFVAVPELNSCL